MLYQVGRLNALAKAESEERASGPGRDRELLWSGIFQRPALQAFFLLQHANIWRCRYIARIALIVTLIALVLKRFQSDVQKPAGSTWQLGHHGSFRNGHRAPHLTCDT